MNTNASQTSTRSIYPWLIVFGALFAATIGFLGFQFGWLDDVLFELNARGTLSNFHNGDALIYWKGYACLFGWLYGWKPHLPWYGIVHLLLMVWLLANLAIFLARWVPANIPFPRRVLAGALLYIAFLLPYCNAPTFTTTSLFLTGLGLINLWGGRTTGAGAPWTFYHLLSMAAGFLIRPRVALLIVIALLPFLVHAILRDFRDKRAVAVLVSPLLVVVGLILSFKALESPDNRAYREKVAYIRPVLDGFNFSRQYEDLRGLARRDSIIMMAARTWFTEDEAIFSKEYFETIGHTDLLHPDVRKNWKRNLAQEWEKAGRYPRDYLLYLNWEKPIRLLLLLNLGLLLLPFFSRNKPGPATLLLHVAKPLAFTFLVLLVAVLYKMEGRVLIPMALVFTAIYAREVHRYMPEGSRWLTGLMLYLMLSAAILLPDYWKGAVNKTHEVAVKRNIIADINHRFHDKVVVLDYYSSWIIHGNMLEYVPLSDRNRYAVWGEPGFHYFRKYREYLGTLCEDISFLGFFECLKDRDDVVFVMSEQRAVLIRDYARLLYGLELDFKPIDDGQTISRLKYSYLWFPMNYRYYVIEK